MVNESEKQQYTEIAPELHAFLQLRNKSAIKEGFEEIKEPSGEKRNEIKGTWAEKDGKKIFTPSL
jgi:hypothetical protein